MHSGGYRRNKGDEGMLVARGLTLGMLGRHKEALRDIERAIEVQPNAAFLHYNRGNLLCLLHNFKAAEKCFSQGM